MSNSLSETLKADGWLRQKNAVGGAWRDADSGETCAVTDPASGDVIGTIVWAGAEETRAAIDAAQAAFRTWSMTLAGERAAALHRMAR